ncbi:MAG: type II secretion system protein [bacterium]|nr:type II secretion system protein [bacterium]
MNKKSGFTIIELSVLAIFFVVAGIIFWLQKADIQNQEEDKARKVAINAIYYNLENVFYAQNGYYPKTIKEDTLKALDPNLLTDPNGVVLGDKDSNYTYEATSCDGEKCEHYTLRASLEKEDDYIKKSKN